MSFNKKKKLKKKEKYSSDINMQWCISQTQQTFIIFINVLGQHVSILIESSPFQENTSFFRNVKMRCGIPQRILNIVK